MTIAAVTPATGATLVADLFMSYVREDLFFVQELVSALKDAGRQAWIDVEGLFPGEDFWPEITRAIDAATIFVFVMTPESVTSRFCLRELAWAEARGKRIIPLLWRAVDDAALPESLARREWILGNRQNGYSAIVASLDHATREDWSWLREHARLLVRAQEWIASGRDPALLLRGRELQAGRVFLARPQSQDAHIVELHRAFVDASTAARRRRISIVSAAGLAVTLTLAVISWRAVDSRIDSLSNRGATELASGNSAAALDPLRAADRMCQWLPLGKDNCLDVSANLVRALLDEDRFIDALPHLRRMIDASGHRQPGDAYAQGREAGAFLSRAYVRAMLAETKETAAERTADYDLADADVRRAAQLYAGTNDPSARLVDLGRARIELGRGHFTAALAALDRLGTFRNEADVELQVQALKVTAYHCLGDAMQALRQAEHLKELLPADRQKPEWTRTRKFMERLTQRCSKKPQ
jgi:TIR domain